MAATGHLSLATARRPSLALIALCANLAVTLPLAYILNIWQDEAFTLQTTGHGFAYAFHQALAFEQNAPLYFVFLSALRHLGSSIFFLRLPSVLCIALAVVLVPELARRYIPAIDAGLVTLVAAWNPFMIWAAVEMRVYALIIALSALLLLTFFDAFLAREPSKTSAVAYAVCCILALYTQYYLGFLIAAQALTLVLIQRRAIGRFALCAGAGVLAFAPMLAIVPAQVENFKSAFTPPTFPRAVEVLAAILARYVLPLTFHHATLAYLVLGAGAIGVAIAARKSFTALGDVTIFAHHGLDVRILCRRELRDGRPRARPSCRVPLPSRHPQRLRDLHVLTPAASRTRGPGLVVLSAARLDRGTRAHLCAARETRRLDPRDGVSASARASSRADRRV